MYWNDVSHLYVANNFKVSCQGLYGIAQGEAVMPEREDGTTGMIPILRLGNRLIKRV